MATLLINYADRGYFQAQKLNTRTGLLTGGLERAIEFGRQHLDPTFVKTHQWILDNPLGAGCWLWKPYIVVAALKRGLEEGDILFYADSGCHFIAPVAQVVEICLKNRQRPILLFSMPPSYLNRNFTKRDCFHLMGLDEPRYADAVHTMASFFVCQKTPSTVAFFEEWLRYAEDPRILTPIPNECGLPDYPDFFQHRFDQSILSLLGRKYEIPTMPDISQWGNDRRSGDIPQIIAHTRWKE